MHSDDITAIHRWLAGPLAEAILACKRARDALPNLLYTQGTNAAFDALTDAITGLEAARALFTQNPTWAYRTPDAKEDPTNA